MKLKNKKRKYYPKRTDIEYMVCNDLDFLIYGLKCVQVGREMEQKGITALPSIYSEAIFRSIQSKELKLKRRK